MKQQLYDLLHECTVRISIPGNAGHGTGFFVAPGLILTCAHVVKAAQSNITSVKVYWDNQLHPARIKRLLPDPDLALLQVNLLDHPCVYLHEEAIPFDVLYSYGYPDDHTGGDPATFTLEGKAGEQGEQLKFKSGQVRPGLSGAPLLNLRTGHVCGVVQLTRDRSNDLGGRAIPTSTVFRVLPDLVTQQQQFHRRDRLWTSCLETAINQVKKLVDRPRNYIPFPRNPLFQPRPDEFEQLEHLLFGSETEQRPPRIGLVGIGVVGMGGIGKTQLAIELAYRYQYRFPGGIFWMSATGTSVFDWHRPVAELAFNTGYLPSDDDVFSPENELRRAQHFCRYLAKHNEALLILDNVEVPDLVISALPILAGGELNCAILYTSRNKIVPKGVTTHQVEQLTEEGALRLLLKDTRPQFLTEVLSGSQDAEARAARVVCQGVGYLPLALMHLHGLLAQDRNVTLVRLDEVLKQRGALDIARTVYSDVTPLFATFQLSWEKVHDEGARSMFILASYFPEAAPIPLWLLGLAAGLGEKGDILEPLGQACVQLKNLSLLEELSREQVRLHPLVREFGQRLVAKDSSHGKTLLEHAGERLITEFTDLTRLERRALNTNYWTCLEQVRSVLEYVELLGTGHTDPLKRVERWLDRESYLLGDKRWWPKVIPGLFYQQLFNRSVEEGYSLSASKFPIRWLRQQGQVGAEDTSLLRVLPVVASLTESVTSVVFSPDGTKILTGSSDGTAQLWETASGKRLALYVDFKASEDYEDFFEDEDDDSEGYGVYFGASEDDEEAMIWREEYQYFLAGVTDMSFSPDGSQFVIGTSNGKVHLWETASGRLLGRLEDEVDRVESVAFSHDGKQIAVGSKSGMVRLWNIVSNKVLVMLKGHQSRPDEYPVSSFAFSPDLSLVLISQRLSGTAAYEDAESKVARLWETKSGKLLATFDAQTGVVLSVAFSPDGAKVLTGLGDETVRLWETRSGKLLATFYGHTGSVECVVFSPDGAKVLTGSNDMTARLWETESGRLLATFYGHTGRVECVAFSPDGTKILTGSDDKTVRLWETKSGKPLPELRGHSDLLLSVAFSPDGTKVLTGSRDETARLWETKSGKLLTTFYGHSHTVPSVTFSPDGIKVLTGSPDGTARLWETKSGRVIKIFKRQRGKVMSVAFSPDGTRILMGLGDGTVQLREMISGRMLKVLKDHTEAVISVVFSPDGSQILTSSYDWSARLWNTASRKLLTTWEDFELGSVWSLCFSPDGTQVLLGSNGGTAQLRESKSGKLLASLECSSPITCVAFSPDGCLAITCVLNGLVFLWRVKGLGSGELLNVYTPKYDISAVYWQNKTEVVLADSGGPLYRPNIYRLSLEGSW